MSSDRENAIRALDMQKRASDVVLITIPQYRDWVERKVNEGESLELIMNLDSQCMWLLPEEVADVGDDEFEELLSDLKRSLGE